MEINKKNRTELKAYFKVNDKPTEKEFADFIDAGINQAEDSIIKEQGSPLAIQAEGGDVGTQEILDLYTSFGNKSPNWSFNLNPRIKSEDPNSNQSGLNIKDATGESRLFIKSGDGSVGVGTIDPESKLTVRGNNDSSLFSVIDTTRQHTKILEVTQKEGVSIKGSLNVDGDFTSKNIKAVAANQDLGNEAASDEKVPSQKAVKTYIDTRLPKGLISLWSGIDIPKGWALCDGTNRTPNLSGRFIVGLDKKNKDYNEIKKTGGLEKVTLTTEQLPSHHHTGTTNDSGNHRHSFTGATKKGDGTGTGSSNDYYGSLTRNTAFAGVHTHSFVTNKTGGNKSHENRPPYYVLAYIMKL
ncbi:phage baseplate protein [Ascidiimonas sp. W6]|uniref:phage baseplate protein n=1 Tax=Ascidiimonas meishanensis TaxID=3128903 RepID=UPI0030ED9CA7